MEWHGCRLSIFHDQRRANIFNPGAAQVSQSNVTASLEMRTVRSLSGDHSARAAGAGETINVALILPPQRSVAPCVSFPGCSLVSAAGGESPPLPTDRL